MSDQPKEKKTRTITEEHREKLRANAAKARETKKQKMLEKIQAEEKRQAEKQKVDSSDEESEESEDEHEVVLSEESSSEEEYYLAKRPAKKGTRATAKKSSERAAKPVKKKSQKSEFDEGSVSLLDQIKALQLELTSLKEKKTTPSPAPVNLFFGDHQKPKMNAQMADFLRGI